MRQWQSPWRSANLRTILAAAFVGVFAVATSALGSWIPSFWGDEAASVLSATRPLSSLLSMLTHVDAVHGLYYLGLKAWVSVAGTSPFATRLPSAVAIGVCAAAVVWLCHRFGSLRFAVTAGVVTALLPRLTFAGEEVRGYAFAAAIATVLFVLVVEACPRSAPSRALWIAIAATFTVGIYAFLYIALMILPLAVLIAVTPSLRRQWRYWLVAGSAVGAAATPLALMGYLQRHQIGFLAHRDVVTARAILVEMWFGGATVAIICWALIIIAIAGLAVSLRNGRLAGEDRDGHSALLGLVGLAWLLLPVGVLIAARPWISVYAPRYGTFAAPAAAIMVALGLRVLWRAAHRIRFRLVRPLAIVAAAALVVVVTPEWMSQRTAYAMGGSDWQAIAATVHANTAPGDGIVFDEGNRPSLRTRLAMSTNPGPFAHLVDVTLHTAYAASASSWHDSTYTVDEAADLGRLNGISRVWVVEYSLGGAGGTWGLQQLSALGYREVQQLRTHHSVIYLYERPTVDAATGPPGDDDSAGTSETHSAVG